MTTTERLPLPGYGECGSNHLRGSISADYLNGAELTDFVSAFHEVLVRLVSGVQLWLDCDDVAALLFPTEEDRP